MRGHKRQLQPFTHRWAVGHPPAWLILIAANVGFYVAQVLVNFSEPGLLERGFGLSNYGVAHGWLWQFVTYTFLHSGWLHLAANMCLLYFAGSEVEAILGVRHFLAIYFGGGILGGIVQWLAAPFTAAEPMLGATACILATLIAFTTILPELEITWLLFLVIPLNFKLKTVARIIFSVVVFCVLAPIVDRLAHTGVLNRLLAALGDHSFRVAHYAHLTGCLLGWAYVRQLGYGTPLRIQRYFLEKRRIADRRKHMSSGQFIVEEIDPILEKIARNGIRSLTREERRLLEMSREKIAAKTQSIR